MQARLQPVQLGYQLSSSGSSVMIGACDTFQAAATEQLKDWASRLNLDVVSGHHGLMQLQLPLILIPPLAKADYLLLDTAGRLHVKDHLMDELSSSTSSSEKGTLCTSAFVVSCRWLHRNKWLASGKDIPRKVGLSGMVVTKLDGTSKGGVIVSIYRELGIPIFYLGLGEQAMISHLFQ